ncbi:MAG: hypothetical protein ACOZNI_31435 [Myxococcota bacterium]
MPIYGYKCSCGKQADVLVRGGREPTTCEEVPELGCEGHGTLTRLLSAPYVGSSGGGRAEPMAASPSCGHCGNAPGSCMADN